VLAYFGYPRAQEQDAENAVKAGLAIVEAAPTLDTVAGGPLHVRVGIATGIVVVGDLLGSGEAQERGVVGDTPNLAARLQGIAEPNTVVISSPTKRLLGNLFELHDLGSMNLKGIAEPVRAFAALRVMPVESRFEALHASGLTPLVGREEELELLLRRWSRAKSGEGQVVLLSGEPGIGKSRLTAELLEHLASEPLARIRHFCSPQHTDSALYPIICQMERASGFTRDDNLKAKLDKLDILLAQSSTSAQDAALFAEMLSLPNDGRYPAIELTPRHRRQRTLEALVLQIVALSRQNPLLLIFEDAHWTDPTSLELFGRVMDIIQTLRVLLVVTFRPEVRAVLGWTGLCDLPHHPPARRARSLRNYRGCYREQTASGKYPARHHRAYGSVSAISGKRSTRNIRSLVVCSLANRSAVLAGCRCGVDGWAGTTAASCRRRRSASNADTKPRKTPIWFALAEDRPLFAFAGLWTRWRGVRGPKSAPVAAERALQIADVRDRRAAVLRRPGHAPARHDKLALAVAARAHDRSHLVGEDSGEQRQVARAILAGAEPIADRRLALGKAVKVAHAGLRLGVLDESQFDRARRLIRRARLFEVWQVDAAG
jgi:hypothetical protein